MQEVQSRGLIPGFNPGVYFSGVIQGSNLSYENNFNVRVIPVSCLLMDVFVVDSLSKFTDIA